MRILRVPQKMRRVSRARLALSLTVGAVIALYLALSLAVSADPLLMPLDDTYIHFQYARQMARGEPMVYNPGDPATSGGTSLIYPPLLALGYALGFAGWALAYWALAVGALCFWGSALLVYELACSNPLMQGRAHPGIAFVITLAYALSGPFIWAALSGMETALFVFAVLLTLYGLRHERFRLMVAAATLMTVTRPEGLLLAGIAVFAFPLSRSSYIPAVTKSRFAGLAIPLLAGLLQPAINFLATGSASSSGLRAKSHLYNTSIPVSERLVTILDFFARMWRQLLNGSSDWGAFYSPLLAVAALAVMLIGARIAWRERRANIAGVMLLWILTLTAAVATLDTAFWQFKRYQLPAMALFFPAASWASGILGNAFEQRLKAHWARWGLPALIVIPATFTAITFARSYADNVRVVRDQQVPMARWVRDHLPEDARIAAHDVGLVRYFGDRALYDVVGLTTPGAARAWREGPGAIYEQMARSEFRPDYFAIYPDVQGLGYLRDAGVMGDALAEFPVELPAQNVASATDYQAVYAANWPETIAQSLPAQTTTYDYLEGFDLVDSIDVGDLESEAAHDYRWWQDEAPPGFVSEVYRQVYRACELPDEAECWATDGGRILNGGEEFAIKTRPGEDLLLVTRVHGRASVVLSARVDGVTLDQAVQPQVPERWVEIVTFIPRERITGASIRVVMNGGSAESFYAPYYHWAFQGEFEFKEPDVSNLPVAQFWFKPIEGENQSPADLLSFQINQSRAELILDLSWSIDTRFVPTDGLSFVHLYNSANTNSEPVVQTVDRPAGGVWPLANWLPGVTRDAYALALPDDLPPGDYALAIGMFNARTGERYAITSDRLMIDDNRLFIGEFTIEE